MCCPLTEQPEATVVCSVTYRLEECAILDQTIKMAEQINYYFTFKKMDEWINKERITKKTLKNLSEVLKNAVQELVKELSSLEMYTLIDFNVIDGVDCGP